MKLPISAAHEAKILTLVRAIVRQDKRGTSQLIAAQPDSSSFFWQYVQEHASEISFVPDDLLKQADFIELNDGRGHAVDIPLWKDQMRTSDIYLMIDIIAESGEIFIRDIRIR